MSDVPNKEQQRLLEEYERALAVSPDGELYARTAMMYLGMRNNIWKALEYFYKAFDDNYITPQCREGVAECHYLLRQYDTALEHYRPLENNGYLTPGMANNIANILVQKKEYKKALDYLEKAAALCSDEQIITNIQRNIDYTQRLLQGDLQPSDPDILFRLHVEKNINALRSLDNPGLLPFGSDDVKGCAVIVELRQHPWLEHALRNVAHFLPANWSMLVVHGLDNQEMLREIITAWGMDSVIGMHNLQRTNITQGDYSKLLKQPSFWRLIPADHALIFQADAMLLRSGLEAFYEWDFTGAPWNDFYVPEGVGNGGLSLRTVAVMEEIARRFGDESPEWEFEDMFFSRIIYQHGDQLGSGAKTAPRVVAHDFCAECQLRDMPAPSHPLGIHQAWRSFEPEFLQKWFKLAEDSYRVG